MECMWEYVINAWCTCVYIIMCKARVACNAHFYFKLTGYPLINFVGAKVYYLKAALICLFCIK